MIFDEVARDLGFHDFDDMVAEVATPFMIETLELSLQEGNDHV